MTSIKLVNDQQWCLCSVGSQWYSTSALTSLTMGTTANLDISDNDVVINAPSLQRELAP